MIGRAASYAEGELRADKELRGMGREQFIERLAYHYDQFNYVHPFREGNGRTQRVFWNRVARDAGWQLDWRAVRGATNDRASRAASEQRDLGPLLEMFDRIVSEAVPLGERDVTWRVAERTRLTFPTTADQAVPAPVRERGGGRRDAARRRLGAQIEERAARLRRPDGEECPQTPGRSPHRASPAP